MGAGLSTALGKPLPWGKALLSALAVTAASSFATLYLGCKLIQWEDKWVEGIISYLVGVCNLLPTAAGAYMVYKLLMM